MDLIKPAIEVLVVGSALAAVFYWLAMLFGRVTGERLYFKWWCKVVVPQGVIVATALKLLGWL
jgi:hypothetical protein